MFTIFELTITHLAEQLKIFFGTAFTIRAIFSCLSEVASIGMNVISTLAIDIGLAILNEHFSKFIESIKVIAGVIEMDAPIKAQPFHRIQNTIGVFNIFFDGIGIV